MRSIRRPTPSGRHNGLFSHTNEAACTLEASLSPRSGETTGAPSKDRAEVYVHTWFISNQSGLRDMLRRQRPIKHVY